MATAWAVALLLRGRVGKHMRSAPRGPESESSALPFPSWVTLGNYLPFR